MDPLEIGLTVAASLAGGAVGGVFTASQIARRSAKGTARYEAEEAVRATVTVYRATMVFDHDQVYETSAYSKDYASVAGQEAFAAELLSRLHNLRPKGAVKVRSELHKLLGDLRYALAEQRAFVPKERLDLGRESKRQALVLHQILKSEDRNTDGSLARILATQNERDSHGEAYSEALASLDAILGAVGAKVTAT